MLRAGGRAWSARAAEAPIRMAANSAGTVDPRCRSVVAPAANPSGNSYCGNCGAPLIGAALPEKSSTVGTPARPVSPGAERRQLTVMFCDLVGSTALASRLDLEDLREVIGDYHKDVERVVGRFDGLSCAKYMGDGVLAYFGYPQAHEDDAERAIRAGLEIVTTARLVPVAPGGRLRVRVRMHRPRRCGRSCRCRRSPRARCRG